jgi:hypothetical protein
MTGAPIGESWSEIATLASAELPSMPPAQFHTPLPWVRKSGEFGFQISSGESPE